MRVAVVVLLSELRIGGRLESMGHRRSHGRTLVHLSLSVDHRDPRAMLAGVDRRQARVCQDCARSNMSREPDETIAY